MGVETQLTGGRDSSRCACVCAVIGLGDRLYSGGMSMTVYNITTWGEESASLRRSSVIHHSDYNITDRNMDILS